MKASTVLAEMTRRVCFLALLCGSAQVACAANNPAAPAVQLAGGTLTDASQYHHYKTTMHASGGTSDYRWALKSGSLPSGLQLHPLTGVISGVPQVATTSVFVISVFDAGHPQIVTNATMRLTVDLCPLAIKTKTLPQSLNRKEYSMTLKAIGGVPGYKWSLKSGQLPAGLSLVAATGEIKGTPTESGVSTFTVGVADSAKPLHQAVTPLRLRVISSLALNPATLPTAMTTLPYQTAVAPTGGNAPYRWALKSGHLPASLTLDPSTGVIAGTPSQAGTAAFTLQVSDSSPVPQAAQAGFSLVTLAPLVIAPIQLVEPVEGQSYALNLVAAGGTPTYSWSIASGSLPDGLSLSPTTGAISGTPTAGGTFTATVTVHDSDSTVQSASAALTLIVPSNGFNTWYVRPDGGTRYSSNMHSGQCDGLGDAPYSGTGVNQHCAFNDVRFLWQDGSYATGPGMPAYGWIGAGGDTYLIRGSLGTGVSYRVGWNNNESACGANGVCYGLQGNPYAAPPVPPSGTASQHTRILGENFASCRAASAKTQLHGGFGAQAVLALTGASYVDVSCLDITDFSSCGRASQTNGCNSNLGAIDDYANYGITWSNTSTNDTVTDVHIHGMANAGMSGATGNNVTMKYIDLIGNASSGWNADDGSGTTGSGTLLVQNFNISWNGCAEQYGSTAALPYADCTDDSTGGYGDGFGTTSNINSVPGWAATFDQGVVSYNTQDGLDALHLTGSGSSMTITRTLAYGNMGQQIKVGGNAGSAINNIIYTNCNALRQNIPGTIAGYNSRLSDFCRAADAGMLMTLSPGTLQRFNFNTVYSASAAALDFECAPGAACDSTSKVDFRNNIFVGFANSTADGYPNPSGQNSSPMYNGTGVDFFGNAGSFYANNLTVNPKANWTCPAAHESNAVCQDPGLTDESWHVYGYGDVHPLASGSVVIGAGVTLPDVPTDFSGQLRPSPPAIGAYD